MSAGSCFLHVYTSAQNIYCRFFHVHLGLSLVQKPRKVGMPWRRRRAHVFGRFFEEWVEDGQSEGSVPDVGSSDTDIEHTEEQHELLNDGLGRALYCGYYRSRCPNDSSEQRYRCRLCKVLCCNEACLARQNGVCRHCKAAWPGMQEALEEKAKNLKQKLLDAGWRARLLQHMRAGAPAVEPTPKTMPRPTTKPMPKATCQSRIPVGLVGGNVSFGGSSASTDSYTLPHHNRQRSRSRSPASNFVGSCPICFERPRNHCLVPCGHRMCLQCGLLCLPTCPQCRGACTQCIRVWD